MPTSLEISANFQNDCRWRLSVSVYLNLPTSQLKYQCILQAWTFTVPVSLVNKNKLTWVLDQPQSFNDFSQWCSKHSRSSFSWVLGKCSFNKKPPYSKKCPIASPEKSHYWYLIWLLIAVISTYNPNLKLYHTRVV